ncbi:Hint domain-containing protein [Roseobacter weihaiensis]|uniref:Hint domain-containing protein n=1 Tax=Roseobacter weihaiensis TaxID=2763262 RepID=UPI001D0B348D|nr:Hint domain-containing protein [Roseobacter sp. H9]
MTPKTAWRTCFESLSAPLFLAAKSSQASALTSGFVENARILTMKGSCPVQSLAVGDRVITRSHGASTVERIEQCSLLTPAVYVIAGSLGHHRPEQDSLLPAGQPVLVRDWRARALTGQPEALCCAQTLVDGEFVRDIGLQTVTLYRVFCGSSQVVYADGMELGTADVMAGAAKLAAITPTAR